MESGGAEDQLMLATPKPLLDGIYAYIHSSFQWSNNRNQFLFYDIMVGCINLLTQHFQIKLKEFKKGEFKSLEKQNHHADVNMAV